MLALSLSGPDEITPGDWDCQSDVGSKVMGRFSARVKFYDKMAVGS